MEYYRNQDRIKQFTHAWADQGKSPSQPYHCLSRSSDNSVSDAQKSRLMYGCAGTLAEDWLEVENQVQERLTLKSWQSGLTI